MTSTLPMAAFEMINTPECKVASRSFRDALAAGLALSAAAVPDCSACIAKCAAPTPLSLSSLALSVPPLLRDASTTSTPSPSDCDSDCSSPRRSASLSPYELLHSDEDDSDSDSWSDVSPCWSGATSFLRTAMPSVAAPLPPLDLCSQVRELDDDADCEDELPGADAVFSDEEGELPVTDSSVDLLLDMRFVWRPRHRALLEDNNPIPGDRWDDRRHRRHNGFPMRYFKSSMRHLRRGATGVDHRSSANNGRSATAQPPPRAPLADPFVGEADQRKKVATAKRKAGRAEVAAHPDNGRPRHRENGKQSGAHQVQRAQAHKQRHSLAAPTRPAVKAARSQAHRLVLQQRAARKAQLVTAAAHLQRAPKHSRPSSAPAGARNAKSKAAKAVAPAAPPPHPTAPKPRNDVSCRNASSFDGFRRAFYLRHRALLEGALGTSGYGRRVTGIRLAPIASAASDRFMTRLAQLRPAEREVALAFHGTRLQNMQSICDRGLLVPNPQQNGVHVANGSACGVGIYTAQDAHYSASYASSSCRTIFACAVLTTGAVPYSYSATPRPHLECVTSGDVFVLMQEARVCPLFLIDFEDGPSGYSSGRGPPAADEPPFLPLKLIRALLRLAHTKSRQDGHRTAALLNSAAGAY